MSFEEARRQLAIARCAVTWLEIDATVRLMAAHQAQQIEERRMAVPQAKGTVTQVRALRDAMAKKLAASQDRLAGAYKGLDDEVSALDDEAKEIEAVTAELRADRAVNGNGGPPLDGGGSTGAPGSASVTSEPSADQRASTWSASHPSLRRPPGT